MRVRTALFSVLASILFLFSVSAVSAQTTDHTLYQYSILDALSNGIYDGDLSLKEILKQGDTGLGTYQNLDGEMIILDGTVYRIGSDGIITKPDGDSKSPFVAVTKFTADNTQVLPHDLSFTDAIKTFDSFIPTKNYFYVMKVEGTFKSIKTRSVPKQVKPYPDLSVVVKKQSVFDFENVEGTLVIVRTPSFFGDINAKGYHMHFISKDKTKGGHVLDFVLDSGTLKIDRINQFTSIFSQTQEFKDLDFDKINKAATTAAEQHPDAVKK